MEQSAAGKAIFCHHSEGKTNDIARPEPEEDRQNIWQIANEQHANWRQIFSDAQRLNGRVDAGLLKHIANSEAAMSGTWPTAMIRFWTASGRTATSLRKKLRTPKSATCFFVTTPA